MSEFLCTGFSQEDNSIVLAIPEKNVANGANGAISDFTPDQTIDATGCIVMPGLIDLAVRLREPGLEHAGMLESEMAAAVAGGVAVLTWALPLKLNIVVAIGVAVLLCLGVEKIRPAPGAPA